MVLVIGGMGLDQNHKLSEEVTLVRQHLDCTYMSKLSHLGEIAGAPSPDDVLLCCCCPDVDDEVLQIR